MDSRTLLEPGTLHVVAAATTEHAIRCGALQPIATTTATIEDSDIHFVLRTLCQQRAPKPRRDPAMSGLTPRNPFLPHDPNLLVAHISATHLCLLNKYTVIDNHLLLVTRLYEHQEQWLTLSDFQALCACMAEFDGLGFYNGGHRAGASQPHKHLQYVPFPMAPSDANIPLETMLQSPGVGNVETMLDLPFVHAFTRFTPGASHEWQRHARRSFELYGEMLAATGLDPRGVGTGGRQTGAYNLLATREWMLIVPRRQDAAEGISVNGLGFAGHLLARDRSQADFIVGFGPLNLLRQVGVPR